MKKVVSTRSEDISTIADVQSGRLDTRRESQSRCDEGSAKSSEDFNSILLQQSVYFLSLVLMAS